MSRGAPLNGSPLNGSPWALPLPVVVTSGAAPPWISAPVRATPLIHLLSMSSKNANALVFESALGRVSLPLCLPLGAVCDVLGITTLPLRLASLDLSVSACASPSPTQQFCYSLRAAQLLRGGSDAEALVTPACASAALDAALLGDARRVTPARLSPDSSLVPLRVLLVVRGAVAIIEGAGDALASLAAALTALLAAAASYCVPAATVRIFSTSGGSSGDGVCNSVYATHEALIHGVQVSSVEGLMAAPLLEVALGGACLDGWLYVSLRRRLPPREHTVTEP